MKAQDNSVKAQKLANESAEKRTAMLIAQQEKTNAMYQDMYNKNMQYAKDQDTLNEIAKKENQAKWNPYVNAGTDALSQYQNAITDSGSWYNTQLDPNQIANDPSYQWRLEQGLNATSNSAAARGGLLGGAAQKALTDYAQGAASNEYQNAWARDQQVKQNRLNGLGNLVNTGMSATGQWTGLNQASQLNNVMSQLGSNYTNQLIASDSSYNDALVGIVGDNYNNQIKALQSAQPKQSMLGGFLSGAASGAAAGSAAGPWGALAGGIGGGLYGAFSSRG